MSVGQPTNPTLVGTAPTPRLRIQATETFLPNPRNMTMMCWVMHLGGITDTYYDILNYSDHSDVIGITLKSDGVSNLLFSTGDLLNDYSSPFVAVDGVWNHYCCTFQAVDDAAASGTGSGPVRARGFANGALVVTTDQAPDAGAGNPTARSVFAPAQSNVAAPPAGPSFLSIFNSRASDSDAGAVFQGNICGVKIWEGVLTPEEIRREMWAYTPQRLPGLWAFSPLHRFDFRTHNYALATNWTSMGTDLAEGKMDDGVTLADPAGVVWDYPMARRDPADYVLITGSCVLGGTVTASITEADIVAGSKTIILTLNGDTWVLP